MSLTGGKTYCTDAFVLFNYWGEKSNETAAEVPVPATVAEKILFIAASRLGDQWFQRIFRVVMSQQRNPKLEYW